MNNIKSNSIFRFCQFLIISIMLMQAKLCLAFNSMTITDHQHIIKSIQNLMLEHYVLLDKAEQVNQHLSQKKFNNILDKKQFIKNIETEVQTILNDKHFRIIMPRPITTEENVDIWQNHIKNLTSFRKGGFQEINMFEGNVGYVKINGFRAEDTHKVDALMSYLSTADAIIFDIRENGGGGEPVNYLSSYFLPDNTLIGKTYHRNNNSWEEHISESVHGQKRLDVPLFIITSNVTFSAAESFAYNLQAQKRAIVVGENSGGGAHPIRFFDLPEGLAIIIPNRRSYNPLTQSNWEGVGVIPNFITSKEDALNTSKRLAIIAASTYRNELFTELTPLMSEKIINESIQRKVDNLLNKLLIRKHIEDFMIAGFARRYLKQGNENAAKLLFQANINLHSGTADPHFQYARALSRLQLNKQAKEHFEKAIMIAKSSNSDQLSRYQNELKKL